MKKKKKPARRRSTRARVIPATYPSLEDALDGSGITAHREGYEWNPKIDPEVPFLGIEMMFHVKTGDPHRIYYKDHKQRMDTLSTEDVLDELERVIRKQEPEFGFIWFYRYDFGFGGRPPAPYVERLVRAIRDEGDLDKAQRQRAQRIFARLTVLGLEETRGRKAGKTQGPSYHFAQHLDAIRKDHTRISAEVRDLFKLRRQKKYGSYDQWDRVTPGLVRIAHVEGHLDEQEARAFVAKLLHPRNVSASTVTLDLLTKKWHGLLQATAGITMTPRFVRTRISKATKPTP